jgi:hypothetical protein
MSETSADLLPGSPTHVALPSPGLIDRAKGFALRHTPEGRRQEYLSKWQHVLEHTTSLPRFELERRLNEEAAKYARDRVTRDLLIIGASAGLGVGGIMALANKHRSNRISALKRGAFAPTS